MRTLTYNDLVELAEVTDEHLVSLYMPLHTGAEHRQNPVRYKNLLRAAEEQLSKRGASSRVIRSVLEPAQQLLDDTEVWQEQGRSLAVFVGAEHIRLWRPVIDCAESCSVGSIFHVIPLVRWLDNEAPYYVLAVSQNDVRLWRGTRGEMEEVAADLPRNMQDALRLDTPQSFPQQHAAQRGTPGKQGLVFHGQGGAPDAAKQEIQAYFREIDRRLTAALREDEPLIFAGVDYLFPIYQEVNSYAHLMPQSIVGNHELWSAREIQRLAWPLVESLLRERREATLTKYGNSISANRAVHRVEDVIWAADAGAVETLFIDPAARLTGAFDTQQLTVQVDERPREDSEDLLNLATVLVLRSSGFVQPLGPGEMPCGGPMAATLRYPLPTRQQQAASAGR
jgi:hypothetical protein